MGNRVRCAGTAPLTTSGEPRQPSRKPDRRGVRPQR
jgi:hypothetical protein